ncbi:MAG: efflux RND transporter permease subunit [Candidatus Eremiobacteraeota bacterium]|nr:efflux RND transporter permease subunit [Candidatus Eremiobacteraeota bacterium]MBC5823179.1 efflux RND transporter permease subunit [Candidatus Eremiobacteraeota bacterium]
MSIAQFAVTRRVSVAMLATAIVVLGIFALPRLPIDLLPSFQPPVISVTVNYGNTEPETMESTVTRPIENAVARVSGIDYLQSDSYQGQTVVRAQFKFGTDINVAANDVEQQVARAQSQLPNDPNLSQPQIVKADPNAAPVVRFYVTDPTRTQRDLSDLFTNVLSDEFSAVSGVGSATIVGGQTRAIMVAPDQNKIAGYGLTNNDIIRKIANENVDDPAGIIAVGPDEFGIRTSALYRSAAEVGGAIIAIKNGAPIYLRDVASVSDSIEDQRVFTRVNGLPAISLVVTAQPDANIVATADGVYAKAAEIHKEYPSMVFHIAFEQRGFIQAAVDALEHTAAIGAVLAVLIILLFLHSWRSTLIVAVSLPVAVLGTLFATYMFHQTLNTMTLGGLALAVGLIVDDAVVVTENIFRHLDEGESPLHAARNATTQIFSAVLSSTITVVTVFVPLLLIPGLQGLIFGPFALTVMTAVAISLLVAVTTVPMLSSVFLRPNEAHSGGRFAARFDATYGRFERVYTRALTWALDRPLATLGGGLALFVLAFIALRTGAVQTEVFPAADSRFARFDLRTPNGTSVARSNGVSRLVEAALERDPRVQEVAASVGAAGYGTQRPVTNQISLAVTLRPDITGNKATLFVDQWQQRLGGGSRGRPGAARSSSATGAARFTPADRARFRALRRALIGTTVRARTIDILQQQIAQGSDALQLQIFGPDVSRLYALAQGVIPQLSTIPGVVRPDTNITATQPEVDVKVDRRKAAQYGFSTGDIAADVATATSGTIASYFQINGIQYPILVQAPPAQRRSFASLAGLQLTPPSVGGSTGAAPTLGTSRALGGIAGAGTPLSTSSGPSSQSLQSVPLSALADIRVGVGPSQISRQDKQRRIDINAPVIGQPLGTAVAAAQRIMDRYPLPAGYRWQFGPAITQNTETFSALGLVILLAVALIYMLLAAQFESFLDPLVIMMAVPFALVGIVGSLIITQRAFGLTAFIGSLMLVGIAVKNAILVVEFTKQLRRDGMSPREAVLHAGPRRLRPILMTTIATIGGMLPLALALEPGASTQAPLGTVVIGGLITSTLLSLLVVPTLYLWTATHIEPRLTKRPPTFRVEDLQRPVELRDPTPARP